MWVLIPSWYLPVTPSQLSSPLRYSSWTQRRPWQTPCAQCDSPLLSPLHHTASSECPCLEARTQPNSPTSERALWPRIRLFLVYHHRIHWMGTRRVPRAVSRKYKWSTCRTKLTHHSVLSLQHVKSHILGNYKSFKQWSTHSHIHSICISEHRLQLLVISN